jgi:GDP-fucose transporter C1
LPQWGTEEDPQPIDPVYHLFLLSFIMSDKEDEKAFLPNPASQRADKSHPSSLIAIVVAFYFIISLSVVFLNKYILSSSIYEFPYPLFVTWFQLVVALVVIFIWAELGKS